MVGLAEKHAMKEFVRWGRIAVVLALILAYVDLRLADSAYEAYRHIHLGMSESDLLTLFHADNVRCAPTSGGERVPVYQFSDYFREYSVAMDETGKVAVMRFQFNFRSHGLAQVWTRR